MRTLTLKRWAALYFPVKRTFLASLALLSFFPVAPFTQAQSAPQTHLGSPQESTITLEHSVHSLTKSGTDAGRVESGKVIERMILTLAPSAERSEALAKFLDEQQNPASPNFHHWLSPEEFGARFGADPASDLQFARAWLESERSYGQYRSQGRTVDEFSGASSQVESAFRTEMHYFRVAGKQYLANATDISLPQSIAQISRGLVSLNNFPKRPPTRTLRGSQVNEQGQK